MEASRVAWLHFRMSISREKNGKCSQTYSDKADENVELSKEISKENEDMEKKEKMGPKQEQKVQSTRQKGKGKKKGKEDSDDEALAKHSPEYDYIEAGNRLREAGKQEAEPRVAGLHFRTSISRIKNGKWFETYTHKADDQVELSKEISKDKEDMGKKEKMEAASVAGLHFRMSMSSELKWQVVRNL